MLVIKELDVLPGNFAEFIAEMAPEYRILYGDRAAANYERTVEVQLSASIMHPSVIAFGAHIDRRVVGIAVGRIAGDIGQIAYIHVLSGYNDEPTASGLIQRVVHALRERSVSGLIMDSIPLCPLRVDEALKRDGFRVVDRMLMAYDLKRNPHHMSTAGTTRCGEADWAECASLLHKVFDKKDEPILYGELNSLDRARITLTQYRDGGYGSALPQWARVIRRDGRLEGVALGTAVSGDVGFIFQVAVEPSSEGKGLGTALVNGLLSEFTKSGMQEVQLGVTVCDSAYRFYTRLGFEDKRSVPVYLWKA